MFRFNPPFLFFCIGLFLRLFSCEILSAENAMVLASSQLHDDRTVSRYSVNSLMDGDLLSCWAEGKEQDSSGEFLFYTFESPIEIERIEIAPGFFDPKWYEANNRIKKMTLIINNERSLELSFPDIMEIQKVDLTTEGPVQTLQFIVEEIYKGSRWDDTCISEISFFRPDQKINLHNVTDDYRENELLVESENYINAIHEGYSFKSYLSSDEGILMQKRSYFVKEGEFRNFLKLDFEERNIYLQTICYCFETDNIDIYLLNHFQDSIDYRYERSLSPLEENRMEYFRYDRDGSLTVLREPNSSSLKWNLGSDWESHLILNGNTMELVKYRSTPIGSMQIRQLYTYDDQSRWKTMENRREGELQFSYRTDGEDNFTLIGESDPLDTTDFLIIHDNFIRNRDMNIFNYFIGNIYFDEMVIAGLILGKEK